MFYSKSGRAVSIGDQIRTLSGLEEISPHGVWFGLADIW